MVKTLKLKILEVIGALSTFLYYDIMKVYTKQLRKEKFCQLSNCCRARVRVSRAEKDDLGDNITWYYVCAKCNQPCDVHEGNAQ
jgi:hypothetical protein